MSMFSVSEPASLLISSGMLTSWCCGSCRLSVVSCRSLDCSCNSLLDATGPVSLSAAEWGLPVDWVADAPCWQQLQSVEWYSFRPASTCCIARLALSRCLCRAHITNKEQVVVHLTPLQSWNAYILFCRPVLTLSQYNDEILILENGYWSKYDSYVQTKNGIKVIKLCISLPIGT